MKHTNYLNYKPALLMLNNADSFQHPRISCKVMCLDLNSTVFTERDQEAVDNVFHCLYTSLHKSCPIFLSGITFCLLFTI